MNDQGYSPKQFGQRVGVTVNTLQRWDREGTLTAYRRPSGRRFYLESQYQTFLAGQPATQRKAGNTVIYYRVSSAAQRTDLAAQLAAIELFCTAKGWPIDEKFTDVGSGLNHGRKDLHRLSQAILAGKVQRLVIAHKDRLVRFGFEWWEQLCEDHQVELVVMNQERLSPEAELVQDLLSIVHCFSSRLYGLRKYSKPLAKDLKA